MNDKLNSTIALFTGPCVVAVTWMDSMEQWLRIAGACVTFAVGFVALVQVLITALRKIREQGAKEK